MGTGELAVGSDGELILKVGPWAKDKLFYNKSLLLHLQYGYERPMGN